MPFDVNVGRRTGVTTLRILIRSICKLYAKFKPTILAWVEGQFSPEQVTTIKAWLDGADAVCFLTDGTPDD